MFELRLENKNGDIVNINDNVNYIVTHVSGLTPPSASLFTVKSPNRKGAKHNGSTLNERQIIITIKILGDVETNRNALYPWIDTEQYCKIHYRNNLKNVYCEGYVEDCPIDVFTESEIISLAIVCGNPYWHDLTEISTEISAILKHFTIPFAIEREGMPFSTLRPNTETVIFNGGSDTGVKFYIRTTGIVENLAIYDSADVSKQFLLRYTIPANWIIVIDTDGSPKTCKAYKPDGTVQNMMPFIGANPTWFELKKGYNKFSYTAEIGATHVSISVRFTNKYLGV